MNVPNFFENLIAGIVSTVVCALIRRFYLYVKTTEENITPPQIPSPAKRLHKQFFGSLFALVTSLPAAFMFPISKQPDVSSFIRIFLFLIAGFSFLFVWGAFDAAFAFYPKNDSGESKPPEQSADCTTQK